MNEPGRRAAAACAAAILVAAAGEDQAKVDAEFSARVDRIAQRDAKPDAPGLAVLVVEKGRVLHSKGYGLGNVENALAVTPRTTFDLASVSKQFTAYAVLRLEQLGKLSLEDDARELLPELPERKGRRAITIADLLQHTSGLPDYLDGTSDFGKPESDVTNGDVAALVAGREPRFPARAKFEYSNSNYVLAALIVERASGRSFRRFLEEEIFGALGMEHARVLDDATRVIPNRAYGYSRREGELRWVHSDLSVTGDGAIWCSLEDFVRWDAELRDPTLVDAARLDRAFTSAKLAGGAETGYGLGWAVGRDGGEPFVEHGGAWVGFLSHHLRYLDSGLAIVVLANVDDGSIQPSRIAHEIAQLRRRR